MTVASTIDGWPQEPTQFYYINGIFTPERSAQVNVTSAAGTMLKLRRLVYTMPRFLVLTSAPSTEVHYIYNRTVSAQLAAYDAAHQCIVTSLSSATIQRSVGGLARFTVASLTDLVRYSSCKGMRFVKAAVENDLIESATGFVQTLTLIGAPRNEDVTKVVNTIDVNHRWGYHTICLTHSQGNIILSQALGVISGRFPNPLQQGLCTAEMSLASPIDSAMFHVDREYLRGFTVNNDLLLALALPNNFPRVDTDRSIDAREPLNGSVGALHFFLSLMWGLRIHAVDHNYFEWSFNQQRIKDRLSELHDECTVGSIEPTPSSIVVPLGDSVRVNLTLRSRAGRVLANRSVAGGGVGSVLHDNSYLVATAPTNGVESVPLTLRNQNEVIGHLSVSTPRVPLAGTVREYLISTWLDTAGFSPNDATSTLPPRPTSEPTWDGNPGSCTQAVGTTGGTAWTDWAQRCGRFYVLEVEANPMPVRAKLRLKFADYPDGVLAGGAAGPLLTPGVPVVDTLSYHCGPEYCLRQLVLESLNVGNTVMTSDTLCFSDRCGASLNRAPIGPLKRQARPGSAFASPGVAVLNKVRTNSGARR